MQTHLTNSYRSLLDYANTFIMKTLKKFLTMLSKDPKDEPIFYHGISVNSSKPFHPAPSFWALIPLKIEQIKYPQRENGQD